MAYFVVEYAALPTLTSKDSPFFDLMSLLVTTLGNWESMPGDMWRSKKFTDAKLPLAVGLSALGSIKGQGLEAEMYDYAAFAEFIPTAYDNQVPSYVPGSRLPIYDEETGEDTGEVEKVTWDKWKGPNQTHFEYEGKHYVPLVHNGKHLVGTVLAELVSDNYKVKSLSEWPKVESVEI